jgi:hypothetical protein
VWPKTPRKLLLAGESDTMLQCVTHSQVVPRIIYELNTRTHTCDERYCRLSDAAQGASDAATHARDSAAGAVQKGADGVRSTAQDVKDAANKQRS